MLLWGESLIKVEKQKQYGVVIKCVVRGIMLSRFVNPIKLNCFVSVVIHSQWEIFISKN